LTNPLPAVAVRKGKLELFVITECKRCVDRFSIKHYQILDRII